MYNLARWDGVAELVLPNMHNTTIIAIPSILAITLSIFSMILLS